MSDLSTRIQIAQDTADTARAMADSLVVTVRDVNNKLVISHTNEEIYNAHQSHQRVILSVEDPDVGVNINSSLIYNVTKTRATFMTGIYKATGTNEYIGISYYMIENNECISGTYRLSKHN